MTNAAHLALRHLIYSSARPEVATNDALYSVLSSNPSSRSAFLGGLTDLTGVDLSSVRVRRENANGQEADARGLHDFALIGDSGLLGIIETKVDSSLHEGQVSKYMNDLSEGGVLIVAGRAPALGSLVAQVASQLGLPFPEGNEVYRFNFVGRSVVVTSWEIILRTSSGDPELESLAHAVEALDDWEPLRASDLDPYTVGSAAIRILTLNQEWQSLLATRLKEEYGNLITVTSGSKDSWGLPLRSITLVGRFRFWAGASGHWATHPADLYEEDDPRSTFSPSPLRFGETRPHKPDAQRSADFALLQELRSETPVPVIQGRTLKETAALAVDFVCQHLARLVAGIEAEHGKSLDHLTKSEEDIDLGSAEGSEGADKSESVEGT